TGRRRAGGRADRARRLARVGAAHRRCIGRDVLRSAAARRDARARARCRRHSVPIRPLAWRCAAPAMAGSDRAHGGRDLMLDRPLTAWLRPAMERGARGLQRLHVHADAMTLLGFALGVGAALAIALEAYLVGLVLMLASRLCDGLDGAL